MVKLLRFFGINCHRWKATHRSGYNRECLDCGEEQQAFQLRGSRITGHHWWETTRSGDGSCGVDELPERLEFTMQD